MITEIISAKWANIENTAAEVKVKLEGFGEDIFDYYASGSDRTTHGIALWQQIQNGFILVNGFYQAIEEAKSIKSAELDSFVYSIIKQGITELGIKVSLDHTTLGYLASIAYLNNVANVIHDSEDIYHTGLSNADVSQVLEVALQAYHDLIAYKKSKEIEIESALDKTELDLIVIGTDFSL
jgi:hypothetical protein